MVRSARALAPCGPHLFLLEPGECCCVQVKHVMELSNWCQDWVVHRQMSVPAVPDASHPPVWSVSIATHRAVFRRSRRCAAIVLAMRDVPCMGC